MDSITVPVHDLYERIKELKDDKMDFVEVMFFRIARNAGRRYHSCVNQFYSLD